MGRANTPAIGVLSGASAPGNTRQPLSRGHLADFAVAAAVFLLEVAGLLSRAVNESGEFSLTLLGDIPVATYLLLGASSIALLWRRSHPLAVLAATLAAAIVWDVLGLASGPSGAIVVALYGAGRHIVDDRTSVLALGMAVALGVVDDLIEAETISAMGLSVVLTVLAWYVGRRAKARRAYLALLEERAEYLERERTAEARRAIAEERNRIARELHDVVAHRVSMITVQAGAAQTVATRDPERAVRAMEAVEDAGREALEELRQVLGVLRSDDDPDALAPLPGLDDISGLVAEMRDAGIDVVWSREDLPPVPARIELATYRIVQEALTNVLKHAGPSPSAEVRIWTDGDMLGIEVTDQGSGETTIPGAGQGLVGMRERAVLIGGTFEAGRHPGGGFRVLARLPTAPSSRW